MFLKLFNSSIKYSKVVVAITGLIFILSVWGLFKLQFEMRVYDLEDPHFPSTINFQQMKEGFRDHNSVILVFKSLQGSQISEFQYCGIFDWLHNEKKTNLAVEDITATFDLRFPVVLEQRLNYQLVVKKDCAKEAPKTAAYVDFSKLMSSPWKNILTSKKGEDFVIEFSFQDQENKFGKKTFDPKIIGGLISSVQQYNKEKNLNLKVYAGGRSAVQWYLEEIFKEDLFINLSVVLILLLVFKFFFGTFRSGFYILFIVMLSGVILFGFMGWMGISIDFLTNGLFLMLCVAGVQDFIFLSHQQSQSKGNWKNHFRYLIAPSFYTSFTTIIGFASLGFSNLPMIQRFGYLAALGAFLEWLVNFLIFPSIISVFLKNGYWVSHKTTHALQLIDKFSQKKTTSFFTRGSFFIFLISISGFFLLEVNDVPRDNLPKSHALNETYRYFKESRGWEGLFYLRLENNLNHSEQIELIEKVKGTKNISHILALPEILNYWKESISDEHVTLVRRELGALGFMNSFLSHEGRSDFMEDGWTRLTLFLKSFDLKDLIKTISDINELCGPYKCKAVGEAVVFTEYSNKVINTLLESFIATFIFIILTLWGLQVYFGHKISFSVVYSICWGPIILVGLLGIFKIPLNLVSGLFLSVLLGMTGDNAIQFIFAARRKTLGRGISKRASGSMLNALIVIFCSISFSFLTFVPMQNLGLLIGIGILVSLIGDLFLLRGLTD